MDDEMEIVPGGGRGLRSPLKTKVRIGVEGGEGRGARERDIGWERVVGVRIGEGGARRVRARARNGDNFYFFRR